MGLTEVSRRSSTIVAREKYFKTDQPEQANQTSLGDSPETRPKRNSVLVPNSRRADECGRSRGR